MLHSLLIPEGAAVPQLLTVAQLAAYLGVCARTVHNWTTAGILPKPVRLSPRKVFYRTEQVRRAIEAIERGECAEVGGN